ncbi:TonB-dependent receptor [Caulobacter sp. CCUG 60055]|nr:TonB-dependent receptor [Caulobacteraceae bacterium]MCI3178677.1 TonB-dependent receptor [Caulobacter sp. CCUG 60055]
MERVLKRFLFGAALGALAAAGAFPALAETAADKADESVGLPELVVTAQRREQSAQDVGIALSVLSGAELEKRGVTNVNQLQQHTPSLEITPAFGGGQPQFRLRGVGFDDYASNNTSTVGVYVNEVAYPLPVMTQGVLFDIDRVEILRGPQGTLYGRNTTGGAVNFLTRQPTGSLAAGVTAEYGSHDAVKVEGYVSGPLVHDGSLRGRLSAVTEQGGAWQHDRVTGQKLGDADRTALRGLLDWDATDKLTFRLDVHGGRDQSDSQGLYLIAPFATRFGAGPTIPADTDRTATGWGLNPAFASIAGVSPGSKPGRDNTSFGAGLTSKLDLGFAKLTSITSYERLKRREYDDWDASASPESDTVWRSSIKVFSQELRLNSTAPGPLNWTAGLYYSNEKLDERFLSDFSAGLGFITDTSYRQKAESISGFGQVEYRLNERLNLIFGLRYENEDRELDNFSTVILPATPTFPTADRTTSMSQVSGKAGVEYKAADHVLLYATVSRGVKSGGFTVYNSTNAGQINPFRPEVLWAYEAGFKADLLDNALRINGAAFYYDYSDQQVLSVIIDPLNGAIGRIINAPKSKIYGAEIEATWRPAWAPGLRVEQSLGWKKGEYTDFKDTDVSTLVRDPVTGVYSAGVTDRSGQDLGFPKLSYQGAVAYAWTIGDFGLEAQADYAYRDKLTSWLGRAYDVDSYWLANASLTLTPNNGPWSVGLWGRNIFDEKYDVTRNFFVNAKVAAAGRPATWGVRASYAF